MHAALAVAVVAAALGAIVALVLGAVPVAAVLAGLAVVLVVVRLVAGRRDRPDQRREDESGPQTDHVVELYQVNGAPGEEDIERFMYAQCGEQGCEFLEFADPQASDQEASLRSKVAVHSMKQSPVIQIYV